MVNLFNFERKQPMRFYEKLIDILEKESSVLIDWFKFNCMQANPDKFQAIAVGNKTHAKDCRSASYVPLF
jgi:hypothetical protein